MANVSEKFGLRPYRKLDGTPLVGAQNRYTIASGHTTAIFQGDMVMQVTGGGVEVLKTTFLDKSMQSILANITFTDLTKKVLVSNVIAVNLDLEEPPASTATTATNSASLEN